MEREQYLKEGEMEKGKCSADSHLIPIHFLLQVDGAGEPGASLCLGEGKEPQNKLWRSALQSP